MPIPVLVIVDDDRPAPWGFTHHALVRAVQRGFTREHIEAVLERPSLTYPQYHYGPDRHIVAGAGLAIAVDTATRTVITVLFHTLDPSDALTSTPDTGLVAA